MAAMSLGSAAKTAALEAYGILGVNSLIHRKHRKHLLVLCYHGVVAQPQRDRFRYANTASVDEFDTHIAALARGFSPVSAADVIAWYGGASLPDHPVLVTFDDGYRNNLAYAAPILRKHRVPCVFHMTTSYIGSGRTLWVDELVSRIMEWPSAALPLPEGGETRLPAGLARRALAMQCKQKCKQLPWDVTQRYLEQLRATSPEPAANAELYGFLSWDEVRELHAQGFEIGSHTVDHPILTQLTPAEVTRQLGESKATIERELGASCRVIAYPNGGSRDFSPAVEEAARKAGYDLGLTIVEDFNDAPADAMAVKRLCIMGHLPVSWFTSRVYGSYRPAG
jgi:peptidoglycan/xylan/chitin deacetylase (PgdA/CDA1 family)